MLNGSRNKVRTSSSRWVRGSAKVELASDGWRLGCAGLVAASQILIVLLKCRQDALNKSPRIGLASQAGVESPAWVRPKRRKHG